MRRITFNKASAALVILSLLAASLGRPRAEEAAPVLPKTREKLAAKQPLKIVCLGDSVTGVYYHTGGWRAYPEMLAIALERACPGAKIATVNSGISGDTTQGALKRLQKDVLDHKPDLVTVMFGLNDMVRVPLADFQENLRSIAEQSHGVGAEVLFCTPNGVIETSGRPSAKLIEFGDAMKAVGQKLNVPVCDCYAAHVAARERDPLAWRLVMSDAIHPNMDGHKLNAEAICRTISGREVSLSAVPPPQPAIPKTLARLKSGEPVKVLAMPPYDGMIGPALKAIVPDAKIEVTVWPTADQTLAQIQEFAKTVRQQKPDLVLCAVPAAVTPMTDPPSEAAIDSYTWVLNSALSFGYQEWDVVGICPSVLQADLSAGEQVAEKFARRLIAAQDLSAIVRSAEDRSSPAEILEKWLRGQFPQK